MIGELQDIVEFLNSFDADLTVISNEWGKQRGVTDADYQRALEKVLSDAEDGV